MKRPARVVHLIENLAWGGGIETVLWEFLRGIPRERFQQVPLFLYQAGPSFERMKAFIPEARFLGLTTYHRIGPLFRLARELKASQADLVHLHGYFSGTFGRLVAPWMGLPWVYSLYSHYEDTYKTRHYFIERVLSKSRGLVVACSKTVRDFAVQRCGISPEKVIINYEGVNVPDPARWPTRQQARERLGIPQDAFVIGTVTRLYPSKNTQLLIRACESLPESCHALIVGEGPELSELQELAASAGRKDQTHFTGLLKDVSFAHQAMDLFVQASRTREGFSIALVEAMGYGKPCAVTTVGGNIEAVTPDAGWWISPDEPDDLRRAILCAMDDRQELSRKAAAARQRYLNNFTGRHMVAGMEAVYGRLLGGAA